MVLKQVNLSPFENKTLLLPFTSHSMRFVRYFWCLMRHLHRFVSDFGFNVQSIGGFAPRVTRQISSESLSAGTSIKVMKV